MQSRQSRQGAGAPVDDQLGLRSIELDLQLCCDVPRLRQLLLQLQRSGSRRRSCRRAQASRKSRRVRGTRQHGGTG